jgi:hypothetical protein
MYTPHPYMYSLNIKHPKFHSLASLCAQVQCLRLPPRQFFTKCDYHCSLRSAPALTFRGTCQCKMFFLPSNPILSTI